MIDEEGRLTKIDYSDRVFFDSALGIAGTTYPIGTAGMPSNVIASVITICTARRITMIEVRGALTLGADMAAYQLVLVGDVTLTPGVNNCNTMIGKGTLSLAGVTGGITNIYVTGGAPVTIAVSCNGGTINIYGNARVTDNSAAGCTVTNYSIDTKLIGEEAVGPYTYLNAGGNQVVYTDARTVRRLISLELDLSNMAQDGTVRLYRMTDAAIYEIWIEQAFDVAGAEKIWTRDDIVTSQPFRINYEEAVDEGADRDIPFNVVTRILEV